MSHATQAAPRSRRFWVTLLIFALCNLAVWAGVVWRQNTRKRPLLAVDSFAPGANAVVGGKPLIQWRFNMDVSAQAGVAPGEVKPAVPGEWKWRDARTLTFVPAEALPKATKFAFTLRPERLTAAENMVLREAYVTHVLTQPLQVLSVKQAGLGEGDRHMLELQFSDRVLPGDVAGKLTVRDGEGEVVKFVVHGQAVDSKVRVMLDPLPNAVGGKRGRQLDVVVAQGLAGLSGPLAMERPYQQAVSVESTLVVTGASARSPSSGQVEVRLSGNGALDAEALKQVVSVEPHAEFEVVADYGGVRLVGDFKPGTRYALKIAPPPAGPERDRYPRQDEIGILVPDRTAGVWFDHEYGYLGAQGNRTVLAHGVNVRRGKVSIYRVYDNNLVAWRNSQSGGSAAGVESFGKPIVEREVTLEAERNKTQDIRIDLDEWLPKDTPKDGVYRLTLEPLGVEEPEERRGWYREAASAVVTLSDIGLTTKRSGDGLVAWAVSLSKGEPIGGVRVRVYSDKNQLLGEAISDGDGLARVENVKAAEGEAMAVVLADRPDPAPTTRPAVVAERGLTWLDLRGNEWGLSDQDVGGRAYHREGYEAFVYTPRGVFRPGEVVPLRAILRDPEMRAANAFPVRWQLRRPDLQGWRGNAAVLDQDGAAEWDVQLPHDVPTGRWTAQLRMPGSDRSEAPLGSVTFYVEEFMPERLKVGVDFGKQSPDARAMVGDGTVAAHVQADYLFGRPGSGLAASVAVRMSPVEFAPAKWSGWTFGDAGRTVEQRARGIVVKDDHQRPRHGLTLDAKGHATLKIDVAAVLAEHAHAGPWELIASADVSEMDGRTVTGGATLAVDTAQWYAGVRPVAGGTVKPGVSTAFDVALVSPEGERSTDNVKLSVTVFRESWNSTLARREGRYRYESHRKLEPITGVAGKSASIEEGKGQVFVKVKSAGSYVLRLADGDGQVLVSRSFYASNGGAWDDSISRENPERLELVVLPAKESPTTRPGKGEPKFAVGERAKVIVRSPFAGRLLLAIETDRVVWTKVVEAKESSVEVPIEVTEAMRPNAYVTATIVRAIKPNEKWRAHRALGAKRLSLDPADRKLEAVIDAPEEVRPESTRPVTVRVTTGGKPAAGAAVVLMAVDEGILQLTRHQTPDPWAFFNQARALGVRSGDLYGQLMPETPLPSKVSAVGGDGGDDSRHLSAVTARRVVPTALISPVLRADESGVVVWQMAVPQFAGKLRVMAVTYDADRVGSCERNVFARSPVLVQGSFPRFAAPGDTFAAPVVVFNNGKSSGDVKVSVELTPAGGTTALPLGFMGRTGGVFEFPPVKIDAGGQKRLDLPIEALERTGVAKVRIRAEMGAERSEEAFELPIRPAAPMITTGGYASASPGNPATLAFGGAFMDGTQRLQVSATPWPQLRLPEALDYLDRYPYGCTEQTISTCFPLIHLSKLTGASELRAKTKVNAGVIRLIGMQTADGGLGMWGGNGESWPWASVYGAHFILAAEAAGHDVPKDFRARLVHHARKLLDRNGDDELIETQAYACYVLALAGKPERQAMARLTELTRDRGATKDGGPSRAQARAHLALAHVASGRTDLAAKLIPQNLPPMRTTRQTDGNVGSPVRDRALLVLAMLATEPGNPALPALVQQIADAGGKGQWRSTQDCAFAALALGEYLAKAKQGEAYNSVRLTAGDALVVAAEKGQSLAWDHATPAAASPYRIDVSGPAGALAHVAWRQSGIPAKPPEDSDSGLKVRRRYLDREGGPVDVADLRSGDLLLVELKVEAPSSVHNIVIEDLLPAGIEVENGRLGEARGDVSDNGKTKVQHFQLTKLDVRDDRLVVVGHLFRAGAATYTYSARAITPGTFVIPPVRAEVMYDIGQNSLSGGGGKMVIKSGQR